MKTLEQPNPSPSPATTSVMPILGWVINLIQTIFAPLGHLLCGLREDTLLDLTAGGERTGPTLLAMVGQLKTCPSQDALEIFAELVSISFAIPTYYIIATVCPPNHWLAQPLGVCGTQYWLGTPDCRVSSSVELWTPASPGLSQLSCRVPTYPM